MYQSANSASTKTVTMTKAKYTQRQRQLPKLPVVLPAASNVVVRCINNSASASVKTVGIFAGSLWLVHMPGTSTAQRCSIATGTGAKFSTGVENMLKQAHFYRHRNASLHQGYTVVS